MNTRSKMIVLGAIALGLSGCLSVEGMKAKMNSGDAGQIADAEQTIIHAAQSWNGRRDGESKRNVIRECLMLINNNDALYECIDSGYGACLVDAAKAVKLNDNASAEKALQKSVEACYRYENSTGYDEKNHNKNIWDAYKTLYPRAIMAMTDADALYRFYQSIQPGKRPAFDGREGLERTANRLCEMSNNQEVLVEIVNDSYASTKQKQKAVAKINKLECKLKLLSNRQFSSVINLTESEVADYLVKGEWRDGDGNGEVRQGLFNRINDQKLLAKIAVEAKADWCRRDAVHKITDKDVKLDVIRKLIPVWIAKDDNDGYESSTCSMIMRLATEQDGLRELVKNLGKGKGFYGHKKVIERIADADIADTMFDTMPLRSNDESRDIIKALVQKLSATKKSKIVSSALERAKVVKDRIVFEAFWVGMPIADFFVLAEHFGIEANAIEYCAGKSGVWHKDYVVSEMAFPSKSCQKFLDCEDADILRQTIHKYVMHKEGKGTVLDYVKLINSEIDHTKTKRFNLMSGFSTKHDFKYWETYSNSKLGTKIWFSEKTGILRFTGL